MNRRDLLLQLYLTEGVGNLTIAKIIHQLTDDDDVDDLSARHLAELGEIKSVEKFRRAWDRQRARPERLAALQLLPHFTILDDCYPTILKEAYRYPCLLFYQGNLDLLKRPMLGLVGTRTPLAHGRQIVEHFLPELLSHFAIVSGLATGMDTIAHETALKFHGETIACLGTGINIYYPRQNQTLQEKIAAKGLLLSEYLPDAGPHRHHFPMRNRIIAGLTHGTVVVAAKKRSGSLITAQMALDNNREVFAVPGSILEENFIGCHELIQQGAKCVTNAQDIIEEFKLF